MFFSNLKKSREKMLENHLKGRNIEDEDIIKAFAEVPREKFVPKKYRNYAYADRPLPIEEGQTISQPYIVAKMLQVVEPSSNKVALEIGTGSGYAAAVLSRIVKKVYGIEHYKTLVQKAKKRFNELGYDNINIKEGNGRKGWEEKAPFDIIIVSAAASDVPSILLEQLEENGRLIIPVGNKFSQKLILYKKEDGQVVENKLSLVRFVPLVSEDNKDKE